jgi:hypothetical protein
MNVTNTSDLAIHDAYTTSGRLGTAAVLFTYSLIGLLFYAIILYVLIKHRSEFDNSYYIMVYYEAAANIGMLLLFILVIFPSAVTNTYFYGETVTNGLANLDTLFFHTMHFYLGPIALNRLFGIGRVFSKRMSDSFLCQLFIARKFVHAWMIFGWLWAVALALTLYYYAHCPKLFLLDQLCVKYECVNFAHLFFQFYQIFCFVYPAMTAIPFDLSRFRPPLDRRLSLCFGVPKAEIDQILDPIFTPSLATKQQRVSVKHLMWALNFTKVFFYLLRFFRLM